MKKQIFLTELTIALTIGILIFSFLPVVQGVQTKRIRPIDDWIYGNDPDSWDSTDYVSAHNMWPGDDWDRSLTLTGNPFGTWRGFVDPETLLVIHFDWVALNDEIEYDGFVLEIEMPDGSLKITVNLHVKDIYIDVYRVHEEWLGTNAPAWMFIEELVLVGTMDYTFLFEFILERNIPGGDCEFHDFHIPPGVREPGAELPAIQDIWGHSHIIGARDLLFKFTGMGSGHLVEPGWLPPSSSVVPWNQPEFWWFLPPTTEIPEEEKPVLTEETAKVKVNQKYLIIPHSPNFYWGWMWPDCDGFDMVKIF